MTRGDWCCGGRQQKEVCRKRSGERAVTVARDGEAKVSPGTRVGSAPGDAGVVGDDAGGDDTRCVNRKGRIVYSWNDMK